MKNTFESRLGIGEYCYFIPKDMTKPRLEGKIVAVRFTEAKVLYDILDLDYSNLYRDVISDMVHPFPPVIDKLEE